MDGAYVVKEISLLSTVFKKTDGNITQMPHTILNTKAIQNYRRSGPTSETVTWDVDFSTSFEAIESLRQHMLDFVETERRDFRPECDITVDTFADQSKITLKSSIPYKTNWANSALKSQVSYSLRYSRPLVDPVSDHLLVSTDTRSVATNGFVHSNSQWVNWKFTDVSELYVSIVAESQLTLAW
jgi:hypothetical protein